MDVKAAAFLALLSGCSLITDSFVTNEFSGDEFPILVDLSSGALRVGIRDPDGAEDRAAVLDILSPLTIIDPGPTAPQSVSTHSLTLLGLSQPGGPADLPRAMLVDARVASFHPCSNEVAPCLVGPTDAPAEFTATIGAEALAGDAVRLRLGEQQIFILPDIGGTEQNRSRACDSVFPTPYRGGGTLGIGGTEVPFGGRRIALATCLNDTPEPGLPQGYRGADAMFVMSTSIGPSLIGESAYRRYVAAHPPCDPVADATCPKPLEMLTAASVNMPSGPVSGRRAVIPHLSLVAASSAARSACRHVYASHFLLQRNCVAGDADCPCGDDDPTSFCGAPAVLHLEPTAGIEMLVVADGDDTLQDLRTELRPAVAEVDGILGTSAILNAEIDVDYPHNRLIARCTGAGCTARPQMAQVADRNSARSCLANSPPGPDFPLP